MVIKRWLRHAFMPPWRWRIIFPKAVLSAIEMTIRQSEAQHRGEIRFAIENALAPGLVWKGLSARQRATEVFSNLRVWDTAENCGVLIYLMLADKEVHIIADRGITQQVLQNEWDAIAEGMRQYFLKGDFQSGSIDGIEQITLLLAHRFPAGADHKYNELPDRPVIIRQ
ncbi:TPM domain-containing protein [Crenothrix polyspora]|uniref:TPM domain-containing protein n=1 Tax=Crenothrix polyspora TaxID=360316 RepID=A0A1R4HFL2_9GAMM|nr:TPM domain-containing protein [Crenothrix polyspora]SJM94801.1 conserved hypothetical protein [Crenothrix polyspora]